MCAAKRVAIAGHLQVHSQISCNVLQFVIGSTYVELHRFARWVVSGEKNIVIFLRK